MAVVSSPAEQLVRVVSEKNDFQGKSLHGLLEALPPEDKEGLNALLEYYLAQGDTVDSLADCYLRELQDFMAEQLYFKKNGHYRYASSREVNEFYYQNPAYMEYSIKGLAISQYLFEQHRNCHAWYCQKISGLGPGGVWLEAGVGHGEYFVQAVRRTDYKQYFGIDISPTSVRMTRDMVEKRVPEKQRLVKVWEQDFFGYEEPVCDAVVLGEILEHVDRPQLFLEKIHAITHEDSFIYITTVVNGPAIDHVYLFRNVGEVDALYRDAGFDIVDSAAFPSHGLPLEKALAKKVAIITAHILKKRPAARAPHTAP